MAIRVGSTPELVNITGLGLPEPVNSIKVIGHGEPHGALFIKKMWNDNMTMEQTAKLALFIIKLIEDTQIDASVGFSKNCLPQVYFLPNVLFSDKDTKHWDSFTPKEQQEIIDITYEKYPIHDLSREDTNRYINSISGKISILDDLFIKGNQDLIFGLSTIFPFSTVASQFCPSLSTYFSTDFGDRVTTYFG